MKLLYLFILIQLISFEDEIQKHSKIMLKASQKEFSLNPILIGSDIPLPENFGEKLILKIKYTIDPQLKFKLKFENFKNFNFKNLKINGKHKILNDSTLLLEDQNFIIEGFENSLDGVGYCTPIITSKDEFKNNSEVQLSTEVLLPRNIKSFPKYNYDWVQIRKDQRIYDLINSHKDQVITRNKFKVIKVSNDFEGTPILLYKDIYSTAESDTFLVQEFNSSRFVSIFSEEGFPRDLYIFCENYGVTKINSPDWNSNDTLFIQLQPMIEKESNIYIDESVKLIRDSIYDSDLDYLVAVDDDVTNQEIIQHDFILANAILNRDKIGLRYNYTIYSWNYNAPSSSSTGIDLCKNFNESSITAFNPNLLNIFYGVNMRLSDGYTCQQACERDCYIRKNIIFLEVETYNSTLIHEVGHHLSLCHLDITDEINIMDMNGGVDYILDKNFTIGQAFKCNFSNFSPIIIDVSNSVQYSNCNTDTKHMHNTDPNHPSILLDLNHIILNNENSIDDCGCTTIS